MNRMYRSLALASAVIAALAFVAPEPAFALSAYLCSPLGSPSGSKRVVNPNNNNAYVTNSRGCAVMQKGDIGYFQGQGWWVSAPFSSVVVSGTADNFTATIPASTFIQSIITQETSGATVTSGIQIGTASGLSDVLYRMVVASGALNTANDISLTKRVFSTTAPQTLYFSSVSGFNSAAVTVTVIYGWF